MTRSRPEGRFRCLISSVLTVVVALACGSPAVGAVELLVRPGSVVRWTEPGLESCGRGERTWPARAGTCWFAIDLLEKQGSLEVFAVGDGVRMTERIGVDAYPYQVQRITLEDSSKVDLSPRDLSRVRREQARVKSLWSLEGPPRFELPLGAPLEALGTASTFGSRRFFNDQPRSPHSGADYWAKAGVPVFSVAPGVVALAEDLFFSGNSVFVDHGDGLISMYFHLDSMSVVGGQAVGQGTQLGKVGQTGRATGPHLHFGLRWKGARVDPSQLLGPLSEIPSLGSSAGPAAKPES